MTTPAAGPPAHPLNRHLVIVDNYHLLKSLDTASVDLTCTDPPDAGLTVRLWIQGHVASRTA